MSGWLVSFGVYFASTSALLERLPPEKCAKKFFSLSGPCFLCRSLFFKFCRRRFLRMSCWLLSLSLLFLLLRDKDQANRSHSPLHALLVLFPFYFCFSPVPLSFSFCLSTRFGRASFCFCLFLRGAFLGPVCFWDFLDCSEAVLQTLVGRAFGVFLFFFPCLRHSHTSGSSRFLNRAVPRDI